MYNNILRFSLLAIYFIFGPLYTFCSTPAALNPFNLSEKELEDMYKNWEKDFVSFLETLPPEEAAQIQKEMEEFERVINNMSEEEIGTLMEALAKEMEQQQAQLPPSQQLPESYLKEPLKVPSKPKLDSTKQKEKLADEKAILKLCTDLATSLEKFMKRIAIISDISSIAETSLHALPALASKQPPITWTIFKGDIEKLVSSLYILQTKESSSNEYKHFRNLVENDTLNTALKQLELTMRQQEPRVKVPSFGLGELTEETKTSLHTIFIALAESLYVFNLLEKIDAVIEKYQSRSQELQSQHAASKEQAAKQKKKNTHKPPSSKKGGSGLAQAGKASELPSSQKSTLDLACNKIEEAVAQIDSFVHSQHGGGIIAQLTQNLADKEQTSDLYLIAKIRDTLRACGDAQTSIATLTTLLPSCTPQEQNRCRTLITRCEGLSQELEKHVQTIIKQKDSFSLTQEKEAAYFSPTTESIEAGKVPRASLDLLYNEAHKLTATLRNTINTPVLTTKDSPVLMT
ncbi:MAG: hypothetical protein WBQ73_00220 [Candidatus Babeliales bacterium]